MRKRNVFLTMPMLRRAQALRTAGLSYEAVVRVLELDYGRSPCESTLRAHLHRLGEPRWSRASAMRAKG